MRVSELQELKVVNEQRNRLGKNIMPRFCLMLARNPA
jgi:hypothetical protein